MTDHSAKLPWRILGLRTHVAVVAMLALSFSAQCGLTQTVELPLTVEQLAERVTAAMARFDDVHFSGSKVTTHELDSKGGTPGETFTIPSKFSFRKKGTRWNVTLDGFQAAYKSSTLTPHGSVSGFDGKMHFDLDRDILTLGEENTSGLNFSAKTMFFRAGWSEHTLLNSFKRDTAKVAENRTIRGHDCVIYQVSFRNSDVFDRLEIAFAPKLSWLPIESSRFNRGKLYSTDILSEFNETEDGLWYAKKIVTTYETDPIPYRKSEITIDEFATSTKLTDDDFKHHVNPGTRIVDYGKGICWIDDPWWDDLAPWLREKHNWPVTSHSELWDIGSFATDAVNGLPAPGIQASEWINTDPGAWERKDRKVSILYFFGGRSIQPHPKWMNAIRKLWLANKANGVELIGVATPDSPELTKQSVKELDITFPVAIDRTGGSFGATHAAFGLRTYIGVIIVDKDGVAHTVEPRGRNGDEDQLSNLEVAVISALAAADSKMTLLGKPWGDMDIQMLNSIRQEWRKRATQSESTTSISGVVSTSDNAPLAKANVTIEPVFRMISGSNPHGTTIINDPNRRASRQTDGSGKYNFEGIPKGEYRIEIDVVGYEPFRSSILINAKPSPATLDANLKAK